MSTACHNAGLAVTASGGTLSTMRAGAGTITHIAPEQFDELFTKASEVHEPIQPSTPMPAPMPAPMPMG